MQCNVRIHSVIVYAYVYVYVYVWHCVHTRRSLLKSSTWSGEVGWHNEDRRSRSRHAWQKRCGVWVRVRVRSCLFTLLVQQVFRESTSEDYTCASSSGPREGVCSPLLMTWEQYMQ